MPLRNQVPSLKLLAIRQIAWPDTLNREKNESYPSNVGRKFASQNVCTLLYGGYSNEKRIFLDKEIDSIINAWIRLSDYYQSRLDEMRQIGYFLNFHSITTLDFLHEGFSLRSGLDIHTFAGTIPTTVAPQPVNPFTWKEISSLIKKSGNSTQMRGLYILFGLTTATSESSAYHFMRTFSCFPRLTKLVVHGAADDHLMHAVGVSCSHLRHLDIRGTKITEAGVILLLFKSSVDVVKFKATGKHVLPVSFLHPLTQTLQYFDMSTVIKQGDLLEHDALVTHTCSRLIGTPTRFFFDPGGTPRFKCNIQGIDMVNLRNKIMTSLRTRLVDHIFELSVSLRTNLQFPCTEVELRVNETGEECCALFYERELLSVEFKIENLTIISMISYTSSTCDFIPLDILARYTPNIREIKASLKGIITRERNLSKLIRLTVPNIYSKETLKGILLHCDKIEYIEIRELFTTSTGTLNDDDINQMMANGPYNNLEVFRILFINNITLLPGLKEITTNCPTLRVIGDFKYWTKVPMSILNRFAQNMNLHNFELMMEYGNMLYHTNTPCKEFFR